MNKMKSLVFAILQSYLVSREAFMCNGLGIGCHGHHSHQLVGILVYLRFTSACVFPIDGLAEVPQIFSAYLTRKMDGPWTDLVNSMVICTVSPLWLVLHRYITPFHLWRNSQYLITIFVGHVSAIAKKMFARKEIHQVPHGPTARLRWKTWSEGPRLKGG